MMMTSMLLKGFRENNKRTYFKSRRSIAPVSPDIKRWNSGGENRRNHSMLIIDLNPRVNAAVMSLMCVDILNFAIR